MLSGGRVFIAAAILSVAGCAQVPVGDEMVVGDWRSVGECIYTDLAANDPRGLGKADLPERREVHIYRESGGVRYWMLVLSDAGGGRTRFVLTTADTMWGPLRAHYNDVILAAKDCAHRS